LLPIQRSGFIHLIASPDRPDLPQGQVQIPVVTTDIEEAIHDARVLMVVVPATGHAEVAQRLVPHLRDGHVIVLNPGRTGGALEVLHILQKHGVTADVIVSEAQTLLYASRALNPGQVQIFGIKNSVPVAAIPAYRTPEVIRALRAAYAEFVPGDNVMKTSMDNIGAIFHPAVTVLNAARIESTHGDFEYYIDGITPSIAQVLETIDAERVAVAAAMGFGCMTAREWLYIAYGASGKTLFDAIRANQGYYGIKAPPVVNHRYIAEDVPMSLVPIASLGEMLGVPCPTIRAIVHLANLMHGCDYWQTGRTVERMGLAGLSLRDIRLRILEGIPAESR
ncbi:MAG: NAD/NADP octopine/nopaline dehydrogenase family protein, partial [Armatimonadota bacterium]|nr:NAD/NADP octopine/nopaline dehydrogenase family protein [Armatimonadota bacterium]